MALCLIGMINGYPFMCPFIILFRCGSVDRFCLHSIHLLYFFFFSIISSDYLCPADFQQVWTVCAAGGSA